MGLKTDCVILCQTEPSGFTAEPSGGRRNRCCSDFCSSKPPLCAPASGPHEAQTATSATAAETSPGRIEDMRAVGHLSNTADVTTSQNQVSVRF